jgi:hypothetical protein
MTLLASGVPPGSSNEESPKPNLVRRMRQSSWVLVAANLVPLYGVLALGWSVAPILFFYWTENLVVGFFNVLKMRRAQGSIEHSHMTLNNRPVTESSRHSVILFFIVHYGIFTLVHGLFVMVLFGPGFQGMFSEIGLALLVLSVSHGYSYRRNFIGRGEYLRIPYTRLFWLPYKRVIVMHLTILLGGALAQSLGAPLGALLTLVSIKTLLDLIAHWAEHKKIILK